MVGTHKKEYSIHEASLSHLSKPLKVLLNGPLREAQELRVEWPDVDEKTFVRFVQWAYTKHYDTEEPEIIFNQSSIVVEPDKDGVGEKSLYSLRSFRSTVVVTDTAEHCHNAKCGYYKSAAGYEYTSMVTCLACREGYQTQVCGKCNSSPADCPRCERLVPASATASLYERTMQPLQAKTRRLCTHTEDTNMPDVPAKLRYHVLRPMLLCLF